jgi:hypothetical protein
MSYAVAWLIEDALRGGKTGSIKAAPGEMIQNDDGTYTVPIQFGDDTMNLVWINEYGVWSIEKAGEVAAGDKVVQKKIQEEKKERKKIDDNLRTDFNIALFAGYAHLIDQGSAFNASLKVSGNGYSNYTVQVLYAGKDHLQIDAMIGLSYPISINKIALIPYADVGVDTLINMEASGVSDSRWEEEKEEMFHFGVSAQAGFMVTTSYVPGLFVKAAYQWSHYIWGDVPGSHTLIAGIGWLF